MKLATVLAAAVPGVVCATTSVQSSVETTPEINTVSVLAILATAVPSPLLAEALTNPAAVSSIISSQFAAMETPAWFSALPKDVQSYLVPATTIAQAPGIFVSALPSAATILTTPTPILSSVGNRTRAVPSSAAPYRGAPGNSTAGVAGVSNGSGTAAATSAKASSSSDVASTLTGGVNSATATGPGVGQGSASIPRTASSTAGAIPTALISAGLGGAVGLFAFIAL